MPTERFLTYNNETKPIAEWSTATGICKDTIRGRLHRGWPVERILTTKASRGGWGASRKMGRRSKEEVNAYKHQWYLKNKARHNAQSRIYHQEHREECTARNKEWVKAHAEHVKAHNADYYRKNKERYAAYQREHRQQNKARIAARIRKRLYKLEPTESERMLTEQSFLCPISHESIREGFHVDHDHRTGQVRGLTCISCNLGLGRFHDDVRLLQNAIEYLTNPPAFICGIRAQVLKGVNDKG